MNTALSLNGFVKTRHAQWNGKLSDDMDFSCRSGKDGLVDDPVPLSPDGGNEEVNIPYGRVSHLI